jgi:hypothetical protein
VRGAHREEEIAFRETFMAWRTKERKWHIHYFNPKNYSKLIWFFFHSRLSIHIFIAIIHIRSLQLFFKILLRHISVWKLLVGNVLITRFNYRGFVWFENQTFLSAPYRALIKPNKMKP